MGKYYLFGAGINCIAVIKFLGKENIIAVIDNDNRKHKKKIEGITIISLDEYLENVDDYKIIITGYIDSKEIANCLKDKGIYNYYICPYMQAGYYDNCEDIINKLELYNYKKLYFCSVSPFSEIIEAKLREKYQYIVCQYIEKENLHIVKENEPIILTNRNEKLMLEEIFTEVKSKLILDINEIYEEKYSYKNEKIMKFKGIHKGKRCFIIGNGPSLLYSDLNTLHNNNEICFGVNRIYLSFEHVEWRPKYYIVIDYMVAQNDKATIMDMEGTKFIRHFYSKTDNLDRNDIYEFRGLSYETGNPKFSLDMYQGIYMGNTVIYDAIQIAIYMGFSEIYLLGVDMTSGKRCEDKGAHFYETQNTKEIFGIGNIMEARRCLAYAGEKIESLGGKLRNATRGGELEEVERVNFDELFD